jgi:hypothetical protein
LWTGSGIFVVLTEYNKWKKIGRWPESRMLATMTSESWTCAQQSRMRHPFSWESRTFWCLEMGLHVALHMARNLCTM